MPLFLWGLQPLLAVSQTLSGASGTLPIPSTLSQPFFTHTCTLPDSLFFHTLEQADIQKHARWYARAFDPTMTRCAIHTATFSAVQPSHRKGEGPLFAPPTSSECASARRFCQLRPPREMNGGRRTLITQPRSCCRQLKSIQNQVVH